MTSTIKKNIAHAIQIPGMIMIFLFAIQACQPMEEENILLITTDYIDYVSEGSYRVTGTLASMGDNEITELGICWGESEKPDIEGPSIWLEPPFSTGKFSVTVSGLSASTTYYFRAYAVIHSMPVYADEKIFTTRPASENMVMDIDGNIYKTVQIGDQTWMAENLKVTRYADQTRIPLVEEQEHWFELNRESKGYCWYDNVLTNGYVYGALYTWPVVVSGTQGNDLIPSGIQGVCPDGWHLPSDSEWKQLEMQLGMSQEDADKMYWRGVDQGGKLKQDGIQYWKSPNISSTGEIKFNALPGGYRHGSGEFIGLGTTARFWSSSGRGYGYGWFRGLDYNKASVYRDFSGVYRGYSVRCVKDE